LTRSAHERITCSVALATYNGSAYISELLHSIAAQTLTPDEVVVSDDGSTDNTVDLVRDFQGTLNLRVIANDRRNGIVPNFTRALSDCRGELIALADQDDVWAERKLEMLVAKASKEERDRPLLVFSDLVVVDQNLALINDSFFRTSKKDATACKLRDFILTNHLPGCSMLINRALIARALPIPDNFRMHDWWLAMVAATFGKIVFCDDALVQYRQHSTNNVGVPTWRKPRKRLIPRWESVRGKLGSLNGMARDAQKNAAIFLQHFSGELPRDDQALLESISKGRVGLGVLSELRRSRNGDLNDLDVLGMLAIMNVTGFPKQ
jgi:glycosyltransferase involved in cell wall biosynthesis